MDELGDPQRAHSLLRRAAQLAPAYAPARNNLGVLHMREGRPDEAAALFEESLARDPADQTAHYNLAALCVNRRDYGGAERVLSKGIEAWPGNQKMRALLGLVFVARGDSPAPSVPWRRRRAAHPAIRWSRPCSTRSRTKALGAMPHKVDRGIVTKQRRCCVEPHMLMLLKRVLMAGAIVVLVRRSGGRDPPPPPHRRRCRPPPHRLPRAASWSTHRGLRRCWRDRNAV